MWSWAVKNNFIIYYTKNKLLYMIVKNKIIYIIIYKKNNHQFPLIISYWLFFNDDKNKDETVYNRLYLIFIY